MKRAVFIAELNEAELAVRLMEIGIGLRRAGDPRTAREILAYAEKNWIGGEVTPFPFGRMARCAIEYFQECMEKGHRPS